MAKLPCCGQEERGLDSGAVVSFLMKPKRGNAGTSRFLRASEMSRWPKLSGALRSARLKVQVQLLRVKLHNKSITNVVENKLSATRNFHYHEIHEINQNIQLYPYHL